MSSREDGASKAVENRSLTVMLKQLISARPSVERLSDQRPSGSPECVPNRTKKSSVIAQLRGHARVALVPLEANCAKTLTFNGPPGTPHLGRTPRPATHTAGGSVRQNLPTKSASPSPP